MSATELTRATERGEDAPNIGTTDGSVKNEKRWYDAAAAAVLFIAVTLAYFKTTILGKPLSYLGNLNSVDALYNPSLTQHSVAINHDPSGYGTYFPVGHFVESIYASAQLPLWNNLNGCGFPILGAISTQIFSVFHLLSLFSSAHGYDLLLVAKSVVAVLSTYLLARLLRLSIASSCFVALAMAFAPRMLVNNNICTVESWYPLIGAAFVWLARNPSFFRAASTGAVCAFVLANMQPEECFFGVVFSSILSASRMILCPTRESDSMKQRIMTALRSLVLAGAFAALFAAPIVLPFLELMKNAHLYKEAHSHARDFNPSLVHIGQYVSALMFGPAKAANWSHPSLLFAGTTATLLILFSFYQRTRFTMCIAGTWLLSGFFLLRPVWSMGTIKPLCFLAPAHGSVSVLMLAIMLAGIGLDKVLHAPKPERIKLLKYGALFASILFLTATAFSFFEVVRQNTSSNILSLASSHLAGFKRQLLTSAGVLLGSIAAAIWLPTIPRYGKALAVCVLIALNFITLFPYAKQTLAITPEFSLQPPAIVSELQKLPGRYASTGTNFFTPCSNLFYGLNDCRNHNTLSPRRYRQFFDQMSAEQKIVISDQPNHLIDLASVKYVLTRSAVSDTKDQTTSSIPLLSTGRVTPGLRLLAGDISYDSENSQVVGWLRWRAHANVSDRYTLQFVVWSESSDGTKTWRWSGPQKILHSSTANRHEIEQLVAVPLSTRLEPGSTVKVGLKIFDTWTSQLVKPDGLNIETSEDVITLARITTVSGEAAQAEVTAKRPKKRVRSATRQTPRRFKLVHEFNEQFRIYENRSALPNAYLVGHAKFAQSEEQALYLVHNKLFDPATEVVIESASQETSTPNEILGAVPSDSIGVVEMERPSPTEVIIKAKNSQAGYLILTDTNYPGWKAYIDGQEVPILKANYLFRAVQLPPGEHIVRFVYQPGSFILGLMLCAFALAAFVTSLIVSAWRGRRRVQPAP